LRNSFELDASIKETTCKKSDQISQQARTTDFFTGDFIQNVENEATGSGKQPQI